MSNLHVDPITTQMAKEYANNEAEIYGFKIGGPEWKKAFKDHISFAVGTMTVGRNPLKKNPSHKYKIKTELYPDIFGAEGFAGQAAKNYKTESKTPGTTLDAIQNRILSAVINLTKLFENGILGTRNTTVGKRQGPIPNADMSEMQLPAHEGEPKEEYEAKVRDVVFNWYVRDLVTDAVLESLIPFFKLSKSDVDEIMGAINIEEADLKELMGPGRPEFVKRLRAQIKHKMEQISYKKMVIG
jgi:hypothetical protein